MSPANRRFLFLLCSTRRLGNSEQLAYCAAHPLPPGTQQEWLHLLDFPLPDFVDLRQRLFPAARRQRSTAARRYAQRHRRGGGGPLYWYGLPASAKLYLDHWSAWLRTPSINFRERMKSKALWAITVSSGERAEAQPLEDSLSLTAKYLHMRWGGLLYGMGSRPNDIQLDTQAQHRARFFFAASEKSLP